MSSMSTTFLTARWRYLAMLNYEVDPAILRSRVPAGTELDTWRHAARWHRLAVTCTGESFLPDDSSEETFIAEHYWGSARQPDGATLEYRVEHPRWSVWRCSASSLVGDVDGLYGSELGSFLKGEPSSAFVAEGSAVVVRKGVRI